uniref:sulfocyanin-like copper-binding protein n=1 Tax=Pigmentiphaga litoralis TaxID=516702 RepID=UPI00389B2D4B
MTRRGPSTVLVAALAAVLMTAASLLAVALLGPPAAVTGAAAACSAPSLPGTTVRVTEADMGAGMMGRSAMRRGMRLAVDRASVPHGQVSLVATNLGSVPHELLVLPLPQGQALGARAVGADGTVDETGSLGEASASCAAGTGEGIAPGAASWVTLDLPAGRYELLCNVPGHYLAGMFAELTVT